MAASSVGKVSGWSELLLRFIVAALAAGEIARAAECILAPELDATGAVDAFAMATPARLFPDSSGHTRMLSHAA